MTARPLLSSADPGGSIATAVPARSHMTVSMAHIPKIPSQDPPQEPTWSEEGPPPPPQPPQPPLTPPREPLFMLPGSVMLMLGLMVVIHVVRSALSFTEDLEILALFAFIPARYAGDVVGFPGGVAADVWTFVTYAMLHGSWAHVITNGIWMVAFGTAVARRFGALRFWLFSAAAAAGGAAFHLIFHMGEAVPVVGASAAIAGQMAAAARFVFDGGGPLRIGRSGDPAAFRRPARSLLGILENRTAVAFIVVFFALNVAIGLGGSFSGGVSVAWQAHVGGFLVGLFTFRWFDPVSR
ncbi:rhomboid family intramembrane serine protease [Acuticoccus sp. M5D2P5]|uniref:rhomboid family intramembrane serine protease n=1 Tax=Acuticoccus kalidii TaxID=2910977 RepID=UPI001F4768D0|nr:rhomboid family intramembrane serine protease [Acuticoccus kalidii]MCF3935651.1 rhomboid family intramembrane serine protease [Acuticoccus kalidii]